MPLLRVMPETVTGLVVPQQFAGSVFDLAPAATYEIELHAVDPDGPVDITQTVTATTKSPPHDPVTPRDVAAANATELVAALAAAKPGDIIHVAKGTYTGTFAVHASGTLDNPIVIR